MYGKMFLYLACLMLPFDSFPFNIYGMGSPKPLSLIFILIFFILNCFNIIKVRISKNDKISFYILFILALITFVRAIFEYDDFKPLMGFFNLIFSFVITYLAIIFVIESKNKSVYNSIKKSIIVGYMISLIIGIMQLITIHGHINSFNTIYNYILRDTRYVINDERIHFAFGEPSYIGLHFFLILIPLYKYISNKNKKFYMTFLIIYYVIGISSFSMQLIIDSIVFVFILLFFYKNILIYKKILIIFACILAIGLSDKLLIRNNYFNIQSPFYYRIISNIKGYDSIYDSNVRLNDQSLEVRLTLAKVGLKSFSKKPLLGYGMGYFGKSYQENIDESSYYWQQNPELLQIYDNQNIPCYVFYLNILDEAGIFGLIFLIVFLGEIFTRKKNINLKFGIMALYFLIQFSLFGVIPIVIILTINKYVEFNSEVFI